jgi:hypothetical protein
MAQAVRDTVRETHETLTAPVAESKTLDALRSRWIFFSACRYTSALSTSRNTAAMQCSSSGPSSNCFHPKPPRHALSPATYVEECEAAGVEGEWDAACI